MKSILAGYDKTLVPRQRCRWLGASETKLPSATPCFVGTPDLVSSYPDREDRPDTRLSNGRRVYLLTVAMR